MVQIPERLKNFLAYNEDDQILGVTEVTLPNLAYITETIAGAGIAGSYDSPTVGHFQSLTLTLNFRALGNDVLNLISPSMTLLTLRGSVQIYDPALRRQVEKQLTIVTDAMPKEFNLGNMTPATAMGASSNQELTYVKLMLDGVEWLEIDKINYICRINGTDYLQTSAQHMGLVR